MIVAAFSDKKLIKMKLILSSISVLVLMVANIKTVRNGQDTKVWKVVWDYLQTVVGVVQLHPNTGLNISQFLEKYNYPLETHQVTTDDGFILTLHRIPYGSNTNISEFKEGTEETSPRPVVLLVHCLACSAMDWIWQGPNASLALLLADQGYDVWLGNTRANVYSMNHQTLTPANASYWDFSFHEKGYYDVPAFTDYILNNTEVEKITYVGHSQGTSAGVVLTSTRPEYNDKFNLMVFLSPVVYVNHTTSPVMDVVAKYLGTIKPALALFGLHGVQYNPYLTLLTEIICNESSSLQGLCIFIIDLFVGFDADQVDRSSLTVFLSNTPSGLSLREVWHYAQGMTSGAFRQYDYGNSVTNFLHYGKSEPPSYDLKKITAPLALYYAKNDFLSAIVDVERFLSELSTDIVEQCLIEYEYFNHLDFITAKDVKTLLYDNVIDLIRSKNPTNRN